MDHQKHPNYDVNCDAKGWLKYQSCKVKRQWYCHPMKKVLMRYDRTRWLNKFI